VAEQQLKAIRPAAIRHRCSHTILQPAPWPVGRWGAARGSTPADERFVSCQYLPSGTTQAGTRLFCQIPAC
jgi:hypothetical protein